MVFLELMKILLSYRKEERFYLKGHNGEPYINDNKNNFDLDYLIMKLKIEDFSLNLTNIISINDIILKNQTKIPSLKIKENDEVSELSYRETTDFQKKIEIKINKKTKLFSYSRDGKYNYEIKKTNDKYWIKEDFFIEDNINNFSYVKEMEFARLISNELAIESSYILKKIKTISIIGHEILVTLKTTENNYFLLKIDLDEITLLNYNGYKINKKLDSSMDVEKTLKYIGESFG